MDQIVTVTLSGNPNQRGYQHGRELKDGVHRFYEAWLKNLENLSAMKMTEADWVAFAGKHGPYIKQYAPDIYEELEGIAEGAEISFDKVVFINCFDEEQGLLFPQQAARLAGQPAVPSTIPLTGCTSFAVFGQATVDEKVYIGQGYDVGDRYFEPVIFRIEAWGDEPEQLVYSHAGVLGVSGINAAKLAIVENSLIPTDQRAGVPYPVVVRKALQQTTLSDFVGAIVMAQRAHGQNYIIATDYAAVDIETSAARYEFKYLQDGVFGHANHYEFPTMKDLDIGPGWIPDTLIRSGRMTQLLKKRFGRIDMEALTEVMSDHANYPNSICRHDDHRGTYFSTLSALIYRPADGLMFVTEGTPCTSPFRELSVTLMGA